MKHEESAQFLIEEIQKLELPAYVTNTQGHICGSNDSGAKIFGYEQADLVGKTEDIFFSHYLDRPSEIGDYYSWRVRKDSEIFFAKEEVIALGQDGNPNLYIKTIEDVSAHLSATEKWELWYSHFQDLNYGVHVTDNKTQKVVAINELMAFRLGRNVMEIIGKHCKILTLEKNYKEKNSDIIAQIATLGRFQFEYNYANKLGEVFAMSTESAAIRDHDGNVAFRVNLSRLNAASPSKETYLN